MPLNYHTTTTVWLRLEDYYNRGVTPEQALEEIKLCRAYQGHSPSYLNGNWNVTVRNGCVEDFVNELEWRLAWLLEKKRKGG